MNKLDVKETAAKLAQYYNITNEFVLNKVNYSIFTKFIL